MTVSRPFTYTNRDYTSLLADLKRRLAVAIPEWTASDGGFETLLLELYAYVGDQLNFYVDRMYNEGFLQTAVLRESVLNLAQMFGYRPSPQTGSTATVTFTNTTAIATTVPVGTRLFAQTEGQAPVFFETTTAASVPGSVGGTATATVVEGTTVSLEQVGQSTGGEQQVYALYNPRVVKDSVRVFTQDGTIDPTTNLPSYVEWTPFERLVDAAFYDKAFMTYTDEKGITYIIFGDNVYGQIPSADVPIFVTYRYGAGVNGNVGVGAIRNFFSADTALSRLTVSNSGAAAGGADAESIESMRTSIPKSLRALQRAVTVEDYASVCAQVAGVAKANATASAATSVTVYIAPTGGGAPSTNLLNLVQAWVNKRAMIGTTVTLASPSYASVNVTVSITVNSKYRQDKVKAAVSQAILEYFKFEDRTFAEVLIKGKLFRTLVAIPGVDYVSFSAFNIDGAGDDDPITLTAAQIAVAGSVTVNASGGVVIT